MMTYDFTPLFRSTVGFDRIAHLLENAAKIEQNGNAYPPYDIQSFDENSYRITMAVAGFSESDLDIELKDNTLTISGKQENGSDDNIVFLHRGIAGRDFVRKFELADHMKVKDAHLDNGVLSIDLYREVPEEMKPKQIEINVGAPASLPKKAKKLIENVAKKSA